MTTIMTYTKTKSKCRFDQLGDHRCFYSGGVLYLKILSQDLQHFDLKRVNAVSVLNGGLTFFEPDEHVYATIRTLKEGQKTNEPEKLITVVVTDDQGHTFKRDWKAEAGKRDVIRWTIESPDLPYYVDADHIVSVTIVPK